MGGRGAFVAVCRPGRSHTLADLFERFTKPARQVVIRAHEEAQTLKHERIGCEHMLLGVSGLRLLRLRAWRPPSAAAPVGDH